MASSVCKSQPPKARKRIVVGLPAKQGTGMSCILSSEVPSNKGIPVSAEASDAHDCTRDPMKASSPLGKSGAAIVSKSDPAKAKGTEPDSKPTRKRKSVADAVNMPSNSAKAKKDKDPNEPKRPSTAFFLFMEEFRSYYKKANPNAKGGAAALGKEGGEKWRSMSDEAKEPFVRKCNVLKEEYEKALQIYKSNGKDSIESTITDVAEEKCDADIESCGETAASVDHTIKAEE